MNVVCVIYLRLNDKKKSCSKEQKLKSLESIINSIDFLYTFIISKLVNWFDN